MLFKRHFLVRSVLFLSVYDRIYMKVNMEGNVKAKFFLIILLFSLFSCDPNKGSQPLITVELSDTDSGPILNYYIGTSNFTPLPNTSLKIDSVDYGEDLFFGIGEDTTGIIFTQGLTHTMQATADGITVDGSVIMPYGPDGLPSDLGSCNSNSSITINYSFTEDLPDAITIEIADVYTRDGQPYTISKSPSSSGSVTIPAGILKTAISSGYIYFSSYNVDPLENALLGSSFTANIEVAIAFSTTS